ncbi:MAG: DUF3578 domain-containing protein [Parabacteroides sp.]|nr:DUF3578 domain-containing protein [Parabacteroides sp.]MDD7062573.1 DUF3578 domain-containing protein [bacterium]
MSIISEINSLFRQVFANPQTFNHAEIVSDIDSEVSEIVRQKLPAAFKQFLGDKSNQYVIKGSVGVGRATKTPWIAIMDKDITDSTRRGIYIAFLFSSDYEHVYLTFMQGTTVPDQFGPRMGKKEIAKNTQAIRNLLHESNRLLKQDDKADIADERYRIGAVYYSLWDTENEANGLALLRLYFAMYYKYKEANLLGKTAMQTEIIAKKDKQEINVKYRPYLTAIKSKPFLLLAGISGTGKSRIVRELARACWETGSEEYKAQKPKNFEMVQVKPNWHDSGELIGYVSRVSGKAEFVAGDFLKFVAKAWEDLETPYFLCLDEMNLAPVEQYFAEYLSVVESRKRNDDGMVVTDPILKKANEEWYFNLTASLTSDEEIRKQFNDEGISLPQNLIVVGTVNMDETTFSFSRKVLDRAMTIEMNEVDLYGGLIDRHERIGKIGNNELVGTAVEGVDVYSDNKDVCDIAIGYLTKLNEILEGTPFKVAYRTRNEFLLYVVNNLPYNKNADGNELPQGHVIARALDEITSMKILSRIEGDDTKVKESLLDNLMNAIKVGLSKIAGEENPVESVSIAKLKEMKDRLNSGYTSFWS